MATLLRSLKYVRRFNLQGRRLGSSLPSSASSSSASLATSERLLQLSRAQCALLHADRTYVTRPVVKSKFNTATNIDDMLNELDQKVRNYQMIYKSNIDQILNAVTEKGSLSSTQALLLIRCCGEFLNSESIQTRLALTDQIWEIIKDLNVPLDVSHYNALLLVYLENEKDFSPVDILLEMKTNNIEPNRVTFQRLIEQYCNKGDIAGATKILEHMSEKEIPINESIFNSLVRGHSQAGDIPSAIKILDIMKDSGIQPTSRTYTEILCAHAKRGDVDAIRSTLNECKVQNIQLADKEILDIIYTLAVNQHLDTIDEMITYLSKGGLYNKEVVTCILKLIEKDCLDIAYKLLNTMIKPENRENFESGGFFLRKLVVSGISPETIIKYCTLLKENNQHNNPFELVIVHMFNNNKQHLALPIMKHWAQIGGEVREHYFYPIFVAHSKDNNLQGLLNTVKSMVFDFKITPSISTIKEYIVPYLVEDAYTNVQTLANNHLPFASAANATLLHLLNQSKAMQAYSFVRTVNMPLRLSMLPPTLARAFVDTKDVDSIANIVHQQYVIAKKNQDEAPEERLTPKEFSSLVLTSIVNRLPTYELQVLTEFLQRLHEKGVGINEEAAERVRAQLGNKITAEIDGILNTLVSEDLQPQDIDRSGSQDRRSDRYLRPVEGSPEFAMMIIQQHARNGDKDTVAQLLTKLEAENPTYTVGFCSTMVDHFSKMENVDEATKWFKKLREINPDAKLDKAKLLNYAIAFVKSNRADEALEVLKYPINDIESNRNTLSEKLIDRVGEVCPERLDEFFKLLEAQQFLTNITNAVLVPFIKVPLKAGDVEKAIENYKWACETYKITPYKIVLMSRLIEKEDAKTLKYVTDISTKVYGEINSLIDLAVAFFECDRPHQARKILETPGLRLSRERMRRVVEKYYTYNDPRLEGFVQLLNGLFLDMDPFYVMLLKFYGKTNNWEKSLALWTQLQEDNIQPSTTFMEELERILRQCNQKIPFATTSQSPESPPKMEIDSDLFEKSPEKVEDLLNEIPQLDMRSQYRIKLAETYLASNNLDKAVSHILTALDESHTIVHEHSDLCLNVIEKLVEADNFELTAKLVSKLRSKKGSRRRSSTKNNVSYHGFMNECYLKQGKYNDFISHLDKMLDDSNDENAKVNVFHGTFNTSVLVEHPEYVENIKKLAFKAVKRGNYFPINSLWCYYYVKDDPEAEVIYNEYLKNTDHFYAISAMYTCRDLGLWNKIPKIVEMVANCEMKRFEKRKTLFQIFNAVMKSDAPSKFEIAYECLRHIVKVVPWEHVKAEHLSHLKAHLPSELSIDSLKPANDRVKEQATG